MTFCCAPIPLGFAEVFPDVFAAGGKNYAAVRDIAVAAIPDVFRVDPKNFDAMRRIAVAAIPDRAAAVMSAGPSVKVAAVLGKPGQYGNGRPKPDELKSSVVNSNPTKGSGPDYWAARLRRDHPDAVFDESVRGSVRQAAIAAGIVKVPTVVAPTKSHDATCSRPEPGLLQVPPRSVWAGAGTGVNW